MKATPRRFALFPQRLQNLAAAGESRLAFRFMPPDISANRIDVTYGGLATRVERLAAGLYRLGLRGERALILHEPGIDFLEALLACLRAGVIAVPVQPSGGRRLAERIQAITADSAAACALGPLNDEGAEILPRFSPDALLNAALDQALPFDPPDPDDIALLQYTSGSTRRPRGVILKHSHLEANSTCIAECFSYGPGLRGVSWLPPYHDMGLIGGLLQPIWSGGCALLLDPSTLIRRPARWLHAITDFKGTSTAGPNFAYELCASRVADSDLAKIDLSTLETSLVGAEPVRPATLDRFARRFAPCGFRRQAFTPCYGLAENTLIVTSVDPSHEPAYVSLDGSELGEGYARIVPADAPTAVRFSSSGKPVREHVVRIVKSNSEEALGEGHVGEIVVKSASVAHGYFGRPDETRETFMPSGLRTGDLGTFINGELYVVGRIKDIVIVNGRKLHAEDIEAAVREASPLLREGACVAFAEADDGRDRLVIVHESSRRVSTADLQSAGPIVRNAVFSAFGVAVDWLAFVPPLSFARTSSGKVQRARSREALRNGQIKFVHEERSPRSYL